MKKKSIDDLRTGYKKITGKDPAIRWNRRTLEKKILDAEILQAGHAARENAKSRPETSSDIKPEFEDLAAGPRIIDISEAEAVPSEQPQKERRGGFREGAGRPQGQSDERARCERLLALEVPDLSVKKIVQGFNLILGRFTVSAFTPDQVDSLALGFTLPMYYWFPSLEGGVANKWALHFQAAELIGKPVTERMQFINQINQQAKEQENGEKENKENIEPEKVDSVAAAAKKPTGEKRPDLPGRKKK